MIDDIDRVEMMLWNYWDESAEPKPEYTKWFYTERKQIVRWLFSGEISYENV